MQGCGWLWGSQSALPPGWRLSWMLLVQAASVSGVPRPERGKRGVVGVGAA